MKINLTPGPLSIRDILRALTNNLNFADNFQAKVLGPITTPGVADTEFTVQHNLGVVPIGYIPNVSPAGVVYDSRRASWTDQQMFLKCNAATVTLYLIVF